MEFLPVLVDIAFVALILVNIFDGRRKGFVKIVLSFAAMIISWIFASEMSEPVALWANETFVHGWVTGMLEGMIADSIGNGADAVVEAIPDYLLNVLEVTNISIQDVVSQIGVGTDPAQAAEQIYKAIENPFIFSLTRIASFFVIYAISNAVLSVAVSAVSRIFKLPILKSFNKLLGSVVGALKGIMIIAIISVVLSLVSMAFPETAFAQIVDESAICRPLVEFVKSIIVQN
ncbi:MAG: CvpA family protein [Clostridia bacterium]|nr:CvpA family protein [Clostridia bacterium]